MKPVMAAAAAAPSTDVRGEGELVAQAVAGSSDAFETLFRRYRDRITAYVRTIIPNHARAEDVVQEVFVSALRKLHTLEEPAAFKPWIYEIARNACFDDVRRVKRSGEVLIRSNDFGPYEEQRHRQAQSTHGKVTWREQLQHLKEALGGLPESQHEALLLREFAGMSYDEIGEQMNLSRPAVESMLFRARRGLKDEYSEITTGKRCRRMQRAMAEIAEGLGGMRERRQLLRHMAECTGCRRQAAALGFTGLAVPPEAGRVRRGVSRVAALLPLPFLFNRRPEAGEQVTGGGSSLSVQAQGIATQVSVAGNVSADHVNSVIHKAAAVVAAVAVIGGGAGVAVEESGVRIPLVEAKDKPAPPKSSQLSANDAGATAGSEQLNKRPGASPQAGHPAAGGHGRGVGPPTLSAPGAPVPGSLGPAGTPESGANNGTAPGDGSSPPVTSPATDTPADSGGNAPTSDTGTGGGGSGGGAGGGGGGGGAAQGTPTGSTSPPTSQGTGQPPASTGGGQPAAPITDTLPPGWQKKIESGKATLDDLPPGLAKKLRGASVPE